MDRTFRIYKPVMTLRYDQGVMETIYQRVSNMKGFSG